MLYRIIFGAIDPSRVAWLYAVVFGSRVSFLAVILLMVSFFIQPIDQALAAEEDAATNTTPAESVNLTEESDSATEPEAASEEIPPEKPETTLSETAETTKKAEIPTIEEVLIQAVSTESEESSEPTAVSVGVPTTAATATDTQSTVGDSPVDTTVDDATTQPKPAIKLSASSSEVVIPNSVLAPATSTTAAPTTATPVSSSSTDSSAPTATTTADVPTMDPAPTAEETSAEVDSSNQNEATNSEDSSSNSDIDTSDNQQSDEEEQPATPRSTSSEPIDAGAISITNDDNYYQFTRQSCVPVGNGNFHCSTVGEAEIDSQSVVYASRADGGDQEIFIRRSNGEAEQITNNDVDDTAPKYDPDSQQIVWQRNIDGRFQIMLYDVARGRESQLTFSRTNNMEPAVSAAGVVWQAWDGNDWEVMHYDGTYTDQITNNQSQDIAPSIEEEYILWSVPGQKEQVAKVYSLVSKEIMTVSGHEGGSILNPRFVLVYDTKFDNGDIITQTYDPETGLAEPITSTPAPEPINIPRPDPIGEIRALINTKSNSEQDDVVTQSTTTTNSLDLASSSVDVGEETLILTPDEDATSTAAVVEEPDFELTEYDLVITPNGISTSSAGVTEPAATVIPMTSSTSATSADDSV